MFINIIVVLILIFVIYIASKAIKRGLEAKQNIKKKENKNLKS